MIRKQLAIERLNFLLPFVVQIMNILNIPAGHAKFLIWSTEWTIGESADLGNWVHKGRRTCIGEQQKNDEELLEVVLSGDLNNNQPEAS